MKEYPDHLKPADYIVKTAEMMINDRKDDSWLLSDWKGLHVGDFILLRNNDRIPADAIAISSGEPDCTCYIETKNLDGETNLKIKRGIKDLAHVRSPKDCKELKAFVDAEVPNANLYSFSGAFHYQDKVIPVGPSGLLLRGCVVRNTSWLIALVIYTGNDTKIMLNSGPTPSKRSSIDKKINPIVVLNAFTLFLFCISCAVCSALYQSAYIFENAIILGGNSFFYGNPISEGLVSFFNCLIVFQNIIPIALYISLEITKSIQSFFIHLDLEMFDKESGQSVIPKSWNLCDDLGQIEYIFSDKTGTLTSNMMDFKKASIGGVKYGKWVDPSKFIEGAKEKVEKEKKFMDKDPGFIDASLPVDLEKDDDQSKRIKGFFSVLAICHTVLVETPNEKEPNKIIYRAQSPDESALVNGAKNAGFACLTRTENKVEIDFLGVTRPYTILHILEFNSDRKRMSVIVQRPEGDIVLMCKGADSVIYERLDEVESQPFMKITSEHLSSFANDGK
jgi:phospholipid-translocating ATPase